MLEYGTRSSVRRCRIEYQAVVPNVPVREPDLKPSALANMGDKPMSFGLPV
jgi:hypothetical protein